MLQENDPDAACMYDRHRKDGQKEHCCILLRSRQKANPASFAFCSIFPCERGQRAAEGARGAKHLVHIYKLVATCEYFSFFILCFIDEPYFPSFFLGGGPFFCTMYEHVVEHLLYCSTASRAQHCARNQPAQICKQVRADQSATTQASRQRASTVLQYCNHSTAQRYHPARSR